MGWAQQRHANAPARFPRPQSLLAGGEAQFAAADADGDGLLRFAEFSEAYLAHPLSLHRQALRAEAGVEEEREWQRGLGGGDV